MEGEELQAMNQIVFPRHRVSVMRSRHRGQFLVKERKNVLYSFHGYCYFSCCF